MSGNLHKLNDVIEHYKRNINRATESNNNEKIMKCLTKLSHLPITVQNLQETGIGRVVNSLRKYDGNLGELAKSLVIQWKNVVKIEESENVHQREENSDEEHQDVSSSNDIEDFQTNQNISITSSVASTSYYNNNNSRNEPLSDENNADSSDHGSSHHRHHDKSKYKKSKKDKDNRKRKESNCSSTDDQGEGHNLKKVKKEHKYESEKSKIKSEKCETITTSHRENNNNSKEYVKKDKKSSHSDKKKDKYKSTHKSESKSSHKDKHESKSGHKDKDKSDPKKKSKDKKEESKPSTSTSCKSFEDALLLGTLNTTISKKKQMKSKSRDRSSSSDRESSPIPENMMLAPLHLDPEELTANYKPLPQLDVRKKKMVEDIDPLARIMTTKNMRTKVYSGNKSTIYTEVPKLLDLCVQIIKDNIDALEYTGGVPYIILEPILKHTTPDQLYTLEHFNDYLIEDTDGLWEYHCKKEFRDKVPEKKNSWRNFYIQCLEEREIKFAKLRKNINANQAASTPVRKTQLAYVDSVVKPPRGVARKQAKLHMTTDIKRNILNKSMMGGNSTAQALSANNKSTTMATGIPVALSSTHTVTSSAAMKKKKAPLMQKALQLIKSTRRR